MTYYFTIITQCNSNICAVSFYLLLIYFKVIPECNKVLLDTQKKIQEAVDYVKFTIRANNAHSTLS